MQVKYLLILLFVGGCTTVNIEGASSGNDVDVSSTIGVGDIKKEKPPVEPAPK